MERNEDVGFLLLFWVVLLAALFWICSADFSEQPTEQRARIVENSVESVESTTIEETTEVEYVETKVIVTAYCPCVKCCGKSDGITASGTKAIEGRTIAVDPRYIPYGTEVVIDGRTYIAEDCGGAIKGNNRIDLFFDSHSEALAFGRQAKTVKVIG